jgi:penicillin-binding protein 2
VAIGQGFNLVTPLQMVVLTSAVANGGTRYKPLIFKSIETAEGEVVIQSKKRAVGTLPASKETLELVRKGLWEVVNNSKGTGQIARIRGVDVSGKTGTAQVVGRKDDETTPEEDIPEHFKAHAWFVAYAPSTDPQIAVAVIVEHGEHGSTSAGPIAREIIRNYLKRDG